MTVRIAQFVHATSDVVDEAFLREFPDHYAFLGL